MEPLGKLFLMFIGFCAAAVVVMLVNGFVLATLWGWFVVPVFGAPPLTIFQAIGITLITTYAAYEHRPKKGEEKVDWTEAVAYMVSKPIAALLIGFVVYQFI